MKRFFAVGIVALGCASVAVPAVAQYSNAPTQAPNLVAIHFDEDNAGQPQASTPAGSHNLDPSSLPGSSNVGVPQKPVETIIANSNPVDRIIANATQANPAIMPVSPSNSYFAPNYYPSGMVPNAFVDYLGRQSCAIGLWDNYGAEQAARCALHNDRISGARRSHCGHCGQTPGVGYHAFNGLCQPSGCRHGHAVCAQTAPVNRYRTPGVANSAAQASSYAQTSAESNLVPSNTNDLPEHSILMEAQVPSIPVSTSSPTEIDLNSDESDKVALVGPGNLYR